MREIPQRNAGKMWAIAVAIAVRYKQSPHGLAPLLAKAAGPKAFLKLVSTAANGVNTYMQTSSSKASLAKGILKASAAVADCATYDDWEVLEAKILKAMKKTCKAPQ